MAFDRYTDAYVDVFPSAAPDLRRYGMLIRSLMQIPNGCWAQYDEAFRQKRKASKLPFCVIDQGIIAKANMVSAPYQSNVPSRGVGRAGVGFANSAGRRKPSWGFINNACFDYSDGKGFL